MRFVDRTAVERLPLGPCDCPGTPHDEDWAELRKEISGADWYVIAQGDTGRSLALVVADWNLVDNDGDRVPITAQTLTDIDLATFNKIDGWLEGHLRPPTLPNASGGPSRNGRQGGRGHRTRTIPTKR